MLYYNKNYFYKKGYNIKIVNNSTDVDLIKEGKVTLDEKTDNYIYIKCLEDKLEDNTIVKINFKAK